MRILITGSRDWDDLELIREELGKIFYKYPTAILVSGACPSGADLIAEQMWTLFGGDIERHPADWDLYGKKAGFKRNAEMVYLGADMCLAFIKNGSQGSVMTSNLAEKAGIPTRRFLA